MIDGQRVALGWAACGAIGSYEITPADHANEKISIEAAQSAGDPNIVSRVGAIGLTQIMPPTGLEIAQDLEIADYSTEMLYHPETNIRMGTYYIRKLLNRFDGDLHAALAAYNWGPHHIAKRSSRREALPVQYPGKILRRIPEQPDWVTAARG